MARVFAAMEPRYVAPSEPAGPSVSAHNRAPTRAPVSRAIAELVLLALLAGVLGSWIVLRRYAFYTHAVGTATFPGLVVAVPWGVSPQLAALAVALGFGAGLERIARVRRFDASAATGLLLVAALGIGIILASDVYESARAWTGCCSAR